MSCGLWSVSVEILSNSVSVFDFILFCGRNSYCSKNQLFHYLISLCLSEILSGLGIWFQTYIEVIELKGLTIVIHQYFLGNILITTAKMSSRSGLFETLHVTTPKKYIYHVELNRPNNLNAMNNTLWMWVFEIPTLFIINILIILEK